MKRAIITGNRGQDGTLLSELLTNSGYEILGIGNGTVDCVLPDIPRTIRLDNTAEILTCVRRWQPDEIFYLAAYHHSSQDSQDNSQIELFEKSHVVHVGGLLRFLEAIRTQSPKTKLLYAASSLVFGESDSTSLNESSVLAPRCMYGITKAQGFHCCRLYRENYGVFAGTIFLFNHESALRARRFVSQKIIRAAVDIAAGSNEPLVLGDLSARIDWGYAPDYVEGMRRIMHLPEPDDFVIATGESHSVEEFVEISFSRLGLNWRRHVVEDSKLLKRRHPPRVGDASKLRLRTGWKPTMDFPGMIDAMLRAESHRRGLNLFPGNETAGPD